MNNNGKKLLDKMSEADPKLIADAYKKPHRKSRLFIGLTSGMATVAAAAMIAVAAGQSPAPNPPVVDDPISSSGTSTPGTSDSNTDSNSNISNNNSSDTSSTEAPVVNDPPALDFSKYKDLPKISVNDIALNGMGGGSTTHLNYADLEIRSPWNGEELETMPVYISGSTEIPDLDKMYARVKEIAAALGISADKLEMTDNYSGHEDLSSSIEYQRELGKQAGATDEEIEEVINRMIRSIMSMVSVEAYADGVHIHLDSAYAAQIRFDEDIELPEGYNFTNSATDKERAEALDYLADRYKELTGYGDPMPGQYESGGGYVYDTDGDLTQQIVNYWINTTQFQINEETGKLGVIWVYTDAGCEKLADYPILTAAQAEAILKSNKYSDRDRMPADAKIVKTDLVYSNNAGSTAVMPYYKFYVEIENNPVFGNELTCDVYSIAAVPEEFIDIDATDYGVRA